MISRKRVIILGVIIALVSSFLTFTISNKIQISIEDKVIVTKSEIDELTRVYSKYSKVMFFEDYLDDNYLNDVSEEELFDGQLKGMFQALGDPYSVYMTKDEFASLMEHTRGTYGGIGVYVAPGDDNLITVVSPIEDTPGERAGLKSGDKIVKVNDYEFTADQMDEAVKIMKGEPGTDVKLTILRKDEEGNPEFIDVPITREEIRIESVKSEMLDNKIGYIRIIEFNDLVYSSFIEHLNDLEDKGMKGLIIDLRSNPGGLLDKCVDVTDELIGKSTIVYTETKKGERKYEKSDKSKLDIPFVLLVNGGSASASEILAGAVKDTKSGLLIGTKTFGKGIVQNIKQLDDGSGFKLTVSKYFTPNGTSIHGIGITPDIIVELPEGVEQIGTSNIEEDTQLKKAIEVLKDEIK